MKLLFSHPFWFSLARLPFRRQKADFPAVAAPVFGQATLHHAPAGRCTMDYMGCEMIALFNALHFLGRQRPLDEIVRTYERRRWLLLGGRWGASPYAIGSFAREQAIPHTAFQGSSAYADLAQAMAEGTHRVFVLSFWLGDTVFSGAHAVMLVRREGQLWGYNLYNAQAKPLPVPDLSCLCYAPRLIVGYAFP